MMLGVDPKPGGNALMTRSNLPASIFFTLCFYTYYFFDRCFYTYKFSNPPTLKPRNKVRRGSMAGTGIAAIARHPP